MSNEINSLLNLIKVTCDVSIPRDTRTKILETILNDLPKILPLAFYYEHDSDRALIEELGQRLRHYESHIFNLYGKSGREKAKAASTQYCIGLKEGLLTAMEAWPKDHCNKEFFWKVILTLVNSTTEDFTADFTVYMVTHPEKAEIWQSMIRSNGLNFAEYESFVVNVMNVVKNPSDLKIIFGSTLETNHSLTKFLTETVLVRRIQSKSSQKRHSYLIAGYLALIAPDTLLQCFAKVAEYFYLQSNNTFNDFEQQKQTAITTADLAKVIPDNRKEEASGYVAQFVPQAIPNYLKLSDFSRRQLGMFIGETIIKLFPIHDNTLVFEYDEDDPMLHEVRLVINEPLENGDIPNALKPKPPPPKEEPKTGPLHKKTILDSDDDEEEVDEAYLSELNDFAAKSKLKTNQIPLLIDKLTEKNDVKRFYSGLHDLLEYLPHKGVPVNEISPQLVNRIVSLENRFNLPHFQLYRQRILETIFYRRPELVSHAVRIMLSRSCETPERYFVLQAMIGAANLISTGKGLEEATKEAKSVMEEVKKESAFEKFKDVTVQGDQRLGKLTRASQTLLKEEDKMVEKKNMYLEYAPQFVYPLIQEEVEGLHLDFTKKEDAAFLARILLTAGILLGFAQNAPTIIPMSQNLLLFIQKVKSIESEDVIESIVFCYGAIAQAMNPSVFFEVFGEEVCDWIEYMVTLKDSDVCDACPRLREVVDSTAGMLIYTVNTVREELEAET